MRRLINITLIFALFFASAIVNAQGVAISDDAFHLPDSSAILDVISTSRGLLPPRMSTTERDAVGAPAEGLIIFNTSSKALEIFNGSGWSSATTTFLCGTSQVADTAGNIYNTIKIGNQCWMAENLNSGTRIDGINDQSDNSAVEKYCYNNIEANCDLYGGLYQWDEMMQYMSKGSQGICPDGWHIPADAEWCTLEKEVDLTINCSSTGWRGTDAGTKLKQGGSSGFTGLLAGHRNTGGSFDNFGTNAYYWTSTVGSSGAWNRYLNDINTTSARYDDSKAYGMSVRCLKNIIKVPTVATETASNITATGADVAGEIVDHGWSAITQYGHCWSISPEPTIDDDLFNSGSTNTTCFYTSNLYDLDSYSTYYVRAYAINKEGISYSEEIVFSTLTGNGAPCPGMETITYEGQVYNTVQIGDQCWLRENLNIGTMIDGLSDQTNNNFIEKYCYSNSTGNCDTYGGLYQWDEMMQYVTVEGAQGICPADWHIPTNVEWCLLEQYLDEATIICDPPGSYSGGIDAGGHLKMSGTSYWIFPNTGATNSSGFSAMPGGYRTDYYNPFTSLGNQAFFWTSFEYTAGYAKARRLMYGYARVLWKDASIGIGYSVRCIKN